MAKWWDFMWNIIWGADVARKGRPKGPKYVPLPTPTPIPEPVPAPLPPPEPTPTPTPTPEASFVALQQAGYLPYYANVPAAMAADYPSPPIVHSVTLYMPTTGGRGDYQKPLSEWNVKALLNGTPSNAWQLTLLNAAAEENFAWHFPDGTGSPWNMDTDPDVTIDNRFPGVVLTDTSEVSFSGTIDDAHQPQLTYLPFLMATTAADKERWLRVLQYQAQWCMLRYGTSNGLGSLAASAEQLRGIAHQISIQGLAAVATRRWEAMALTPSQPLLSAEYLYRKLENNLKWLQEITVDSGHPWTQAFRLVPWVDGEATLRYPLWQNDWIALALGWLTRMGFTRARTIFDWMMVGIKYRAGDTNNWGNVVHIETDGTPVLTYPELWANCALGASDWDVNHFPYGALCLAASLGDSAAATLAAKLRTRPPSGLIYSELGHYFDPTVRPVVMTQPSVSTDPQYQTFRIVSSDTVVFNTDGDGRQYIATASGQTVNCNTGSRAQMVFIHYGATWVECFTNAGMFSTDRRYIVSSDAQTYDVVNRVWL